MSSTSFKAGFVHLVGKPNAGKSTLFNALLTRKLSIITPKAQTTRHNILGIKNEADAQCIYVDTPGYLMPKYALHQVMMHTLYRSLEGADCIVWVVDIAEGQIDEPFAERLQQYQGSCLVVLNKKDLVPKAVATACQARWKEKMGKGAVLSISSKDKGDTEMLAAHIKSLLPSHAPYHALDAVTDRPVRFFVAELIREAALQQYHQELPYSMQIEVNTYKEEEKLIRIATTIYVERKSQQLIVIGKKGAALKALGIAARKRLEAFLHKQLFLTTKVVVAPSWRRQQGQLRKWGYV